MFYGTRQWWSIQGIFDALPLLLLLTAISAHQSNGRTNAPRTLLGPPTKTSNLFYLIFNCCSVYGRLLHFVSYMSGLSARFARLKYCWSLSGAKQHTGSQDTLLSRSRPHLLPQATWGALPLPAASSMLPIMLGAPMQPFCMGLMTSAGPLYTRPEDPEGASGSTENKSQAKREAIRSAFNANLDISEIVNRQKGPRWASSSSLVA